MKRLIVCLMVLTGSVALPQKGFSETLRLASAAMIEKGTVRFAEAAPGDVIPAEAALPSDAERSPTNLIETISTHPEPVEALPVVEEKPALPEKQGFLEQAGSRLPSGLRDTIISSSGDWLRPALIFIFVSSMVLIMAALLGRRGGGREGVLKPKVKNVTVKQTITVGLKHKIAVVEFGDARLVVGLTANDIKLLYAEPPAGAASAAPEKALNEAEVLRMVSKEVGAQVQAASPEGRGSFWDQAAARKPLWAQKPSGMFQHGFGSMGTFARRA